MEETAKTEEDVVFSITPKTHLIGRRERNHLVGPAHEGMDSAASQTACTTVRPHSEQ